jgi:hypothetical protein
MSNVKDTVMEMDYFKLINELKKQFELKTGLEPTHLIVSIEEYYNIENSSSLLERLKYIRDTTQGLLGEYILGLRIIKTNNIGGIKVAYTL